MADKSAIEWTDATWNPIRARNLKTGKVGWHCEHATTGCEFCYAEGFNRRLGTGLAFKPGHRKDIEIFLDEEMLTQPLRWKKPRMIFPNSMTDLFADFVPFEWIDRIFAVMALTPQHTYQPLTKRAARMCDYVDGAVGRVIAGTNGDWPGWPLPNVWLGVSAERQAEANERIPLLLQTPAAKRFISAEPLLGPLDLAAIRYRDEDCDIRWNALTAEAWVDNSDSASAYSDHCDGVTKLDWVIAGGESGRNARPMHPEWARALRDQCAAAGVPFFFKQWGEWAPIYFMSPPDAKGNSQQLLDMKQSSTFVILHAGEPKQFPINMVRVGKQKAGRDLDGELHNGFPAAKGE